MTELCNGRVKISKALMRELGYTSQDDRCFSFAKHRCEQCGKLYCKAHINKHVCIENQDGKLQPGSSAGEPDVTGGSGSNPDPSIIKKTDQEAEP
jgi:hypothetical protein